MRFIKVVDNYLITSKGNLSDMVSPDLIPVAYGSEDFDKLKKAHPKRVAGDEVFIAVIGSDAVEATASHLGLDKDVVASAVISKPPTAIGSNDRWFAKESVKEVDSFMSSLSDIGEASRERLVLYCDGDRYVFINEMASLVRIKDGFADGIMVGESMDKCVSGADRAAFEVVGEVEVNPTTFLDWVGGPLEWSGDQSQYENVLSVDVPKHRSNIGSIVISTFNKPFNVKKDIDDKKVHLALALSATGGVVGSSPSPGGVFSEAYFTPMRSVFSRAVTHSHLTDILQGGGVGEKNEATPGSGVMVSESYGFAHGLVEYDVVQGTIVPDSYKRFSRFAKNRIKAVLSGAPQDCVKDVFASKLFYRGIDVVKTHKEADCVIATGAVFRRLENGSLSSSVAAISGSGKKCYVLAIEKSK